MTTEALILLLGILIQATAIIVAYLTARTHFRATRATEYINRFNQRDFRELRRSVDDWICEDCGSDDKLQKLMSGECSVGEGDVRAFANFFQELGLMYSNDIVDKKTTRLLFDFLAPHYGQRLRFWIDDYRSRTGDTTLYRRFLDLATELSTNKGVA